MTRKWLAPSLLSLFIGVAAGQQTAPAPDNTKVNEEKSQTTADQAKNNATDRDIMKKIRKEVMAEKSLSTYAHNVKIIAQNGKVTLKGPVRTEEEKKLIEDKATSIAGAGNVSNEITIKPENK